METLLIIIIFDQAIFDCVINEEIITKDSHIWIKQALLKKNFKNLTNISCVSKSFYKIFLLEKGEFFAKKIIHLSWPKKKPKKDKISGLLMPAYSLSPKEKNWIAFCKKRSKQKLSREQNIEMEKDLESNFLKNCKNVDLKDLIPLCARIYSLLDNLIDEKKKNGNNNILKDIILCKHDLAVILKQQQQQ
jgi:hypothetical protein